VYFLQGKNTIRAKVYQCSNVLDGKQHKTPGSHTIKDVFISSGYMESNKRKICSESMNYNGYARQITRSNLKNSVAHAWNDWRDKR